MSNLGTSSESAFCCVPNPIITTIHSIFSFLDGYILVVFFLLLNGIMRE